MQKYQIINEEFNLILCKLKYGTRYYACEQDKIPDYFIIVETTKNDAENARDYRNETHHKGWEIKAV